MYRDTYHTDRWLPDGDRETWGEPFHPLPKGRGNASRIRVAGMLREQRERVRARRAGIYLAHGIEPVQRDSERGIQHGLESGIIINY